MLIRLSFQTVGDTVQGAAYYFSRPGLDGGGENFVGPICAAVAKNGDIYVGSIYDSGWLGGRNTGAIERLRFRDDLPNGIRELRATADGFDVRLCQPVHPADVSPADFSIAAYTRKWQGSYATADSSRHPVTVAAVRASDDGRRFRLIAGEELRPGFVYEVTVGGRLQGLFPATGHYTMNRVPQPD